MINEVILGISVSLLLLSLYFYVKGIVVLKQIRCTYYGVRCIVSKLNSMDKRLYYLTKGEDK